MNKKVLIPLFASAMGLSLIGGISGAVAWYQYNTRVTASYVGTSIAESGLLEIGKMGANSQIDYSAKDLFMETDGSLKAVTFGETEADEALPAQAYYRPEAGVADMTLWQEAAAGSEYFQFDIYLRARQFNSSSQEEDKMDYVAKDVYLSDLEISIAESAKVQMREAVRVHLDVEDGDKFLIANSEVSDLPVYGGLDLDQEAGNDIVGGYQWASGRNAEIVYGYPNATAQDPKVQNALGKSDIVNARVNNVLTEDSNKVICQTKTDADVKITVTVWIEGWAQLTTKDGQASPEAVWDPVYGDGATVRVGMTFDVGGGAFSA